MHEDQTVYIFANDWISNSKCIWMEQDWMKHIFLLIICRNVNHIGDIQQGHYILHIWREMVLGANSMMAMGPKINHGEVASKLAHVLFVIATNKSLMNHHKK